MKCRQGLRQSDGWNCKELMTCRRQCDVAIVWNTRGCLHSVAWPSSGFYVAASQIAILTRFWKDWCYKSLHEQHLMFAWSSDSELIRSDLTRFSARKSALLIVVFLVVLWVGLLFEDDTAYCFQLAQLLFFPLFCHLIFKLLLYTYKALHGLSPDYLANLLTFYKPVRTLRSSRSNNLSVPRSRTSTYGDKTFACVSPRLWNQLPDFIRYSETLDSFKTRLKTHLFKIAFNL